MANITISSLGDAASSSSMASCSASTSYSDCDVFINHRGPDVKNNFASHLYQRLSSSYLRVFLDREEMKKGENFISQIEQAIRAASVHIAIFSPRYAQSKWCLKELVLMVKSGATILPVFYKVDPSVVRLADKSGAYFEALRVLEQKTTRDRETDELKPRHSSDTIQEWENALSSVADIDGMGSFVIYNKYIWLFVITEVRGIRVRGSSTLGDKLRNTNLEMPWYKIWSDELFGNCLRHLVNDTRFCGISNLQFLVAENGYVGCILKKVRSPHLRWLDWHQCPYTCLPSWTPMENLRVLEVSGSRLKTLWQHESRAPLQLRQLIIICAPLFSNFPKFIGQLKYLEKIDMAGYNGALKSLPEEFGDLRSLKVLSLHRCLGMKSLPDSFGKLTNLQDIRLLTMESLQMLPNSFGKLTRLKRLDLSDCSDLTISSVTLGNITTLEYLNITRCRSVTELPIQVAHQRSLKELWLSGANLKELPSEIGNLCNLEVLSISNNFEVLPPLSYLKSLKQLRILYSPRLKPRLKYLPDHFSSLIQLEDLNIEMCGIEYLPQDLPKMNNLRVLRVLGCPLLELPFKKIEEERETGRELNKLESVHDNDKSMFGLTKLMLFDTEISEVFFAESVCPNLRFLYLQGCQKLTKIGGLCGLSKLQHLRIKECIRIEELPNIEMLISLEELNVGGCVKLKSIPGLGQLRKLRDLDVSGCHEIVELSGAKHLMMLKHLNARECPKLRWDEGVLEEVRQRLKEGLEV